MKTDERIKWWGEQEKPSEYEFKYLIEHEMSTRNYWQISNSIDINTTLTPVTLPKPQFTEEEWAKMTMELHKFIGFNNTPSFSKVLEKYKKKIFPTPTTPWGFSDFAKYLGEIGTMEGVEVKIGERWELVLELTYLKICLASDSYLYSDPSHIRHQDPQGEWVETECTKEQP